MSIMSPNEGKQEILARVLYGNAGSENLSLRLFKNNVTPAETDTTATYTVANFTGYSNQTLTSSQAAGTWPVPTVASNLASSTYATTITWTATSDQTIYGYFIVGASSGKTYFSQAFASPKSLVGADSDQISIIPKIQLGHL